MKIKYSPETSTEEELNEALSKLKVERIGNASSLPGTLGTLIGSGFNAIETVYYLVDSATEKAGDADVVEMFNGGLYVATTQEAMKALGVVGNRPAYKGISGVKLSEHGPLGNNSGEPEHDTSALAILETNSASLIVSKEYMEGTRVFAKNIVDAIPINGNYVDLFNLTKEERLQRMTLQMFGYKEYVTKNGEVINLEDLARGVFDITTDGFVNFFQDMIRDSIAPMRNNEYKKIQKNYGDIITNLNTVIEDIEFLKSNPNSILGRTLVKIDELIESGNLSEDEIIKLKKNIPSILEGTIKQGLFAAIDTSSATIQTMGVLMKNLNIQNQLLEKFSVTIKKLGIESIDELTYALMEDDKFSAEFAWLREFCLDVFNHPATPLTQRQVGGKTVMFNIESATRKVIKDIKSGVGRAVNKLSHFARLPMFGLDTGSKGSVDELCKGRFTVAQDLSYVLTRLLWRMQSENLRLQFKGNPEEVKTTVLSWKNAELRFVDADSLVEA